MLSPTRGHHHHRRRDYHHPRRLVQTQRRVISRGVGRERRQSGALEKRLSAVKNAGELLVCLARYKRPAAALSGRSTPPLPGHRYFGAIRAVKKKKGEKTPTVLLFFLLLFFLLLLLLFWLRLTDPQSELLRIEFFEKRTAGCSGECFSRMDFRDGM